MTKKDTNPRLAMYEKIKYRKKVLQMLAMFAEGERQYFSAYICSGFPQMLSGMSADSLRDILQ